MKDVVENHPNMYGIRPFMAMFLSAQGKHDEALAQITRCEAQWRGRCGYQLFDRIGLRAGGVAGRCV